MEEIIRGDLKESKVGKAKPKDNNAWKYFIINRATHTSVRNRR